MEDRAVETSSWVASSWVDSSWVLLAAYMRLRSAQPSHRVSPRSSLSSPCCQRKNDSSDGQRLALLVDITLLVKPSADQQGASRHRQEGSHEETAQIHLRWREGPGGKSLSRRLTFLRVKSPRDTTHEVRHRSNMGLTGLWVNSTAFWLG